MSKKKTDTPQDDIVVEESAEDVGGLKTDEVKKLKEKLKHCLEERKEYLDGWQRMKADGINLKKEEEKKREEIGIFVKEDMLDQLLPVLDSFELAFRNKETWERVDENWRKGVEYIHEQLFAVLKDNGLEVIDFVGRVFDPHVHTSVEIVETKKMDEDGMVLEVFQRGYALKGNIIRPAHVKVGKFVKN